MAKRDISMALLSAGSAGVTQSAGAGTAATLGNRSYEELQHEVLVWRTYPDACKLIKTQSEVFHAAEEGVSEGAAFVYPIVDAFGKPIGGDAVARDEQTVHQTAFKDKMRLVELLAVVGQAPEPKDDEIFRMVSTRLALCAALKSHLNEDEIQDPVDVLEKMHDIAEYLQLDKRLCARVLQISKAEGTFLEKTTAKDVQADGILGPLLKKSLDQLAATSMPKVLMEAYRVSGDRLDLPELLSDVSTLTGALGWGSSTLTWPFGVQPAAVTKGQLCFLFGQAIASRNLDPKILAALRGTSLGSSARFAERVVEAMVVLGKKDKALQLVEKGGIPLPSHLTKTNGSLDVCSSTSRMDTALGATGMVPVPFAPWVAARYATLRR